MTEEPIVELGTLSAFSFLQGASLPEELMVQAAHLGFETIGLADWHGISGVVRAHRAAKEYGIRLIPGTRFTLSDGSVLLAYPIDRTGWGWLCKLLTLGHHRGERARLVGSEISGRSPRPGPAARDRDRDDAPADRSTLLHLARSQQALSRSHLSARTLCLAPTEDPETYRMIQRADTLGTFQIESRAQMAMLPRMKPTTFYDLVIQVAIVRPGPIQGDMVHPYLRRRAKIEPVTYPTATLENILGKTLGVPLFQEQAMQVAIHCAGFTPGEADQLRRAMATFKMTGGISPFREKLIAGMQRKGYTAAFAEETFSRLEGFGSYGFPESHAASFALTAYASSWMKCRYPDVFCAALLNSQPMGLYAPAQIVQDARAHGVEIRPICVNASRWDCTLERSAKPASNKSRGLALRLGLRLVRGLANKDAAALIAARMPLYESIDDMWRRGDIPLQALEALSNANAFASFGVDRRAALRAVKGLDTAPLPLFAAADRGRNFIEPEVIEPDVTLPVLSARDAVHEDYRMTGLSLEAHPVSFLRPLFDREGMTRCGDLATMRDGARISIAGLVLMRQRPGTAHGTMFITLEDETGIANLIVWKSVRETWRRPLISAHLMVCHGTLQKEGEVIHVIMREPEDRMDLLKGSEPVKARNFR